jgi:hypothetical protein
MLTDLRMVLTQRRKRYTAYQAPQIAKVSPGV